jgi:hypothetical protein
MGSETDPQTLRRSYSAGVDIELPPVPLMAHVPVPLHDGHPRYYPELVEAFEALGFRRIGGLRLEFSDEAELEELIQAHPAHVRAEFQESAQTPETLLVAPDSSAFAGVDWFYRQPSVRLRSLLADGRLVETQRGWDHLPVPVVEMEPYVDRVRLRPEQDRSARGRVFTIVPGAGAAEVWDAHRRALSDAGSRAVEHRSIDQAASLWRQVLTHDAAIERNVPYAYVRILRTCVLVTVPVVLVLIFVGIYFWAADGSSGAEIPWLAAASFICLATALALGLVAKRLTSWLRYRPWIRPPFRGEL